MADKGRARWEEERTSSRVQSPLADWRWHCSTQVTLQLEVWVQGRLSCCVTPLATLPSLGPLIQTGVYVFQVRVGEKGPQEDCRVLGDARELPVRAWYAGG